MPKEKKPRKGFPYRTHFSIDGEYILCGVNFHMNYPQNIKITSNLEDVNCGSCIKTVTAYRNQPSILIREGAEEIYKHIRRIERENKHSGRKINN